MWAQCRTKLTHKLVKSVHPCSVIGPTAVTPDWLSARRVVSPAQTPAPWEVVGPVPVRQIQPCLDLRPFGCCRRWETHVDVSLAVAQEEVVHDGAVVQVLQRRHVLHTRHAALVHLVDLLPGEGALFVGVHLHDSKHQPSHTVLASAERWSYLCLLLLKRC